MSETTYKKLTGKKRSFLGFSQAWLGDDHLLIIDSTNYVEKYHRFALEDIQAIVIAEGPNVLVWQIVALAISAAWGLWAVVDAETTFGKIFWGLAGGAFFLAALQDLLRGQRCTCSLQTAVSRECLRSVARLPKARKF